MHAKPIITFVRICPDRFKEVLFIAKQDAKPMTWLNTRLSTEPKP